MPEEQISDKFPQDERSGWQVSRFWLGAVPIEAKRFSGGFLTANWARAARRDRSPESPPVLLTALASGRVDRQLRLPRAPDRAQKCPLAVHSAAELASEL